MNRRQFLQASGMAGAGVARGAERGVTIVVDPSDSVARAAECQWALGELRAALRQRGVETKMAERLAAADGGAWCVVAAGGSNGLAQAILRGGGVVMAAEVDALALGRGKAQSREVVLASGQDARGLVYAVLELADRVRYSASVDAAMNLPLAAERPANRVRSVARLFTSDVEDKGWFRDREMWGQYLTMLARERFNRFHLAFGIGYDFLRQVTDGYLVFTYPFLMAVPGYDVKVPQLPDAERDENLATLRFISEQAAARGIDFQLGLWMHGYEWIDSPHPNYTIAGLTKENHGPYCRDAVRALLRACPAIKGVTFRVHGESGVEEGSYEFWKTVFSGVSTCGRTVEIDMHSKGMDQTMLDLAVGSGMPVRLSPKFWAEHMGMPYHQADIRDQEVPKAGRTASALMKFSAGSRSFLRYGYGDLLREDRKWNVLHRIWPGTQRVLLWGDPVTAAGYSRAFGFCGSDGVDLMEPLSFKGRRGSGIAGDRCAYADQTLRVRWDWQKYEYSYRVWGRLLYNPDCNGEVWRRLLTKEFGARAADAEMALSNASRILPIVTTAHGASAANNTYWPEVYWNQSMMDAGQTMYTDTPAPRVFGNVSPFDPQLFSRINDYADELMKGERGGKYSPVEVAQWLEDLAGKAGQHLARLDGAAEREKPEWRRWRIDVRIQMGLGRFFAAKFRSGVLYRLWEQSGDREALEGAVRLYRAARSSWVEVAELAKGVYMADITVGERPNLRGHWLDRVAAIDADIQKMEERLAGAKARSGKGVAAAIREATGRPMRGANGCRHQALAVFRPGAALAIELGVEKKAAVVRLYYRHVTQAERWQQMEMAGKDGQFRVSIPGSYATGEYPLQYYFEIREGGKAWLYPGLGDGLGQQPYFLVRRARG